MKKNYLLIFLIFLSLFTNAQVAFHKTYGGLGGDYADDIVETTNGDYVSIGQTNSFGAGGWDVYLVKTNRDGVILWTKTFGGVDWDFGQCVRETSDGGYILSGYTQSFGSDVFLIKTDSNGIFLWSKTYGGVYGEMGASVEETADGGYIITGTARSFGVSDDVYVIKTDNIGSLQWTKTFGGSGNDFGHSGIQTSDGGYLILGETMSFGAGGPQDAYLIKLDVNGNKEWSKTYGGSNSEIGWSVLEGNSGEYFLTGSTSSFRGNGSNLVFFIKTDSIGNVLISKVYGSTSGGEMAYSIQKASEGYVIAGETYGFGNSGYNMYMIKTDSIGNALWSKSFLGDAARSVKQTLNGNYILAGSKGIDGDFFLVKTELSGNSGCDQINLSSIGSNVVFTVTNPPDIISSGGVEGTPAFIIGNAGATISATLCNYTGNVWPGDADNSYFSDNYDLLPIGLYYSQTGIPRSINSNIWQADSADVWGISQTNGFDIKHADCNGDGVIDANDTVAINLNFNLTHTIIPGNITSNKMFSPILYFVTDTSTYNAGDWIIAELWAGDSSLSVNSLYGIAFNISYDVSFVQPGTESVSYTSSWLGTPNIDAIKIAKIDPLAAKIDCGITRINHTNINGYGKIADFKFKAKTSISSPSFIHLFVSNYFANDSVGNQIVFNTLMDSVMINPVGTSVKELNTPMEYRISPNPFNSQTIIFFNEVQKNTTIKIIDEFGKEIKSITFSGKQLVIEKGEMPKGIYFIQVIDANKKVVSKKILVQ
ncbi:MAG: hypothetical protein A3F72_04335 [Bacteroidetes bacterium RIFCSPLOWO2_12_FULL_35_15]|nr:MAG: hypothetical protein A3F72_04335 [Bacteroidetes bacterium RIFCSPLOWO2_12_FULL_35_15]